MLHEMIQSSLQLTTTLLGRSHVLTYAILSYVLNRLFPRVTGEYFPIFVLRKKKINGGEITGSQLVLFVYNGAPARLYIYKSLGFTDRQLKDIRYLWFHYILKI